MGNAEDKFIDDMERLLDEAPPDKIGSELRGRLTFYSARRVREINAQVKKNKQDIRLHRFIIGLIVIYIGYQLGVPLLAALP